MRPGTPDEEWREDCAPRRVLELFATKWTSMVLHTLHARHGGAARTGVLQRSLSGLSKKMLTQTVRDMERSGLLDRHVQSTIPPMVEYRRGGLLRLRTGLPTLVGNVRETVTPAMLADTMLGRVEQECVRATARW